jgi:two-component system cell cycle sensor histidine kinase/response regulator CckA
MTEDWGMPPGDASPPELRRLLADALFELHRRTQLLDAARDAIYARDEHHVISYWNHAAEELYGWSAEEAVGRSSRSLLYRDSTAFDESATTVLQTGSWRGDLEQVAKSGRTIIAACRWTLIEREPEDDTHRSVDQVTLCVISDVTDERAEDTRRHGAERMESLGTFAGGIAHDLNNVFTPILMTAQILALDEPDETRHEMLTNIQLSVARASDMIRQILLFARGQEGRRVPLSVSGLLDELRRFCRDALPETITVTFDISPDLDDITADATQILQVLMNLVTNARDAMPTGGALLVVARNHPADAIPMVHGVGKAVVFSVTDTGTGMDAQTMARMFEPFFTTKGIGTGTGLGLSTSIAIARGHGGALNASSTPGHGSSFHLYIPATSDLEIAHLATVDTRAVSRSRDEEGNGERILVIEDDDTIRSVVVQTLELNGYQTRSAADGAEGIEILHDDDTIRVVLTDIMMPVMDGIAVAGYLSLHHPAMPLIGTSGVASHADTARAAQTGPFRFLDKPFSTENLLDAVHTSLHPAGNRPGQRTIADG